MNIMRWIKWFQWMHCAAGIILISVLAGCKRDEVKVYNVPKEASAPPQPSPAVASDVSSPAPAAMPLPQLTYRLPESWQNKAPSEMRVASFAALGPNGQSADVSVIPLPIVGRDLELVNMWRSQVQLAPTSEPNAVNQAEPVTIGVEQGRLFDFVSEQPMIGKARQRILVALFTRGPMSWFFKMTGEDAFVTSQKGNFLQFLKSISFTETPTPQSGGPPPIPSESTHSIWTVPSDWQSLPPSEFLVAKFLIQNGAAKAEVNVSEFAGEAGGPLANVNRWRGQLGLNPLKSELELSQLFPAIDLPSGGQLTLVDLTGADSKTGKPARLVGAIVPQSGQTWFYKLMGDAKVVESQKDAFTQFVQSAKY